MVLGGWAFSDERGTLSEQDSGGLGGSAVQLPSLSCLLSPVTVRGGTSPPRKRARDSERERARESERARARESGRASERESAREKERESETGGVTCYSLNER